MPERWALLLLLTLHACCALAGAQLPRHLTQADVWSSDAHGYSAPPADLHDTPLPGGALADTWQPVTLPHVMPRALVRGLEDADPAVPPTTLTWYRVRVDPPADDGQRHYLYIPRWKTDGQLAVYGDGRLLYLSQGGVNWNGWNIPLWIPLDATRNARVPGEILLRIERPRGSGGGISSLWLESSDHLNWRYRVRNLLQVQLPYTSSAAFLAVGLFSLFVWLRLRQDRSYLLFFFIAISSFLRTLHYHVGQTRLPIPEECFTWITLNSVFWTALATHFFLDYLHRHPRAWLDRSFCLITLVVGVVTAPGLSGIVDAYALAPLVYIALILMGSVIAGFGWTRSWRVQSRDGLLLSGWAVVGMLLGGYDWLLQNNYVSIESIYLGPYSNIGAFLIFMHIIYRRYVGANESVREINANLKTRLKEREQALEISYQRLREIEHRQTLSNERQRMMQDMHDGMGSSLLTALLQAEKGQMNSAMLADVLKTCIDDLKLTIDSLEPVQADLLLLLATLRFRLAPRLESAGIRLQWEIRNIPALEWLDPRNGLHILRILQEAFANIIKHTQATLIRVTTTYDQTHVRVTVIDDGQGFAVQEMLAGKGKGLNNQLRRAASIGADIHWVSTGEGTCLTLVLPIQPAGTVAGSCPAPAGQDTPGN